MSNFALRIILLITFITISRGIPDIDKSVIKSDLQHIGCDVCMRSVSLIHDRTEEARSKAPYKKLKEEAIMEVIDNVCDIETENGMWMRMLNIEEYKHNGRRYLRLTEPGGMSTCGRECGTIEKSCTNLFDDEIDRDELTVFIYQNNYQSVAELQVSTFQLILLLIIHYLVDHALILINSFPQEEACKKLSKRCKVANKNVVLKNNSKRVDYPFNIITKDEIDMEKMKRNMKAGGGGHILSTAELQAMNRGDDDEDEGDYKRGESINENGDTVIRF